MDLPSFAHGLLLFFLGAVAVGWALIFARRTKLNRGIVLLPLIQSPSASYKDPPCLSIIIPARNEEDSIRRSLGSILSQDYQDFEVILVDDGSEDRTAEIGRTFQSSSDKISIMSCPDLPQGWVGKNWACYHGYKMAKGDWLLFLDADSLLHPHAVTMAMDYARRNDLDFLSLKPLIECKGFWSKVTTPMFLNLMAVMIPMAEVNDPSSRKAYFYGSFILAKRSSYHRVGGHESVKKELVEDRALGMLTKSSGLKIRLIEGGHVFSSTWNNRFDILWKSLLRIVSPSVARNSTAGIGSAVLLSLIFIFPPITLLFALASSLSFSGGVNLIFLVLSSFSVLMNALVHIRDCKYLRISKFYSLATPVGASIFISAILYTIRRGRRRIGVSWRGRIYLQSSLAGFDHLRR